MPAEKIVEKILSDAKNQAKGIELETKKTCETLQKENAKKLEQDKKETIKKANLQGKTIRENYRTLAHLESKKIKLKAMQDVAKDAQNKAVDLLYDMEKLDALSFVAKLVAFAEMGDTLKVDLKNLTLSDVKKLKEVKEKKLKVEKGEEKGIVFEGKICDKNFTLLELVSQKYNEQEKKYNDILFN